MKDMGTVVGPLFFSAGVNLWSVPLFGVPLTVIGMAVLGASLAAGYGKPAKTRRELFTSVAVHAFLGTVLVAVVPAAFGMEWVSPKLEAPLAGLVAFGAKFAVPLIPWKELVRKVFRLEHTRGEDG